VVHACITYCLSLLLLLLLLLLPPLLLLPQMGLVCERCRLLR
jgi:hypothetical protein